MISIKVKILTYDRNTRITPPSRLMEEHCTSYLLITPKCMDTDTGQYGYSQSNTTFDAAQSRNTTPPACVTGTQITQLLYIRIQGKQGNSVNFPATVSPGPRTA